MGGNNREIDYLGIQTGGKGTMFYPSGTEFKTSSVILQVNADAVFTTLTDSDGNDLRVALNILGNTCTAGSIIKALNGKKISVVELASGSVWGVQ